MSSGRQVRTSTAGCGALGREQAQDARLVGRELAEDPRVGRMGVAVLVELRGALEQRVAAVAQRLLGPRSIPPHDQAAEALLELAHAEQPLGALDELDLRVADQVERVLAADRGARPCAGRRAARRRPSSRRCAARRRRRSGRARARRRAGRPARRRRRRAARCRPVKPPSPGLNLLGARRAPIVQRRVAARGEVEAEQVAGRVRAVAVVVGPDLGDPAVAERETTRCRGSAAARPTWGRARSSSTRSPPRRRRRSRARSIHWPSRLSIAQRAFSAIAAPVDAGRAACSSGWRRR